MTRSPIVDHWEQELAGLAPGEALVVLNRLSARQEEIIRQAQIRRALTHKMRKAIANDNWPKDEDGFLTLSDDNPMA